MWEVILRVRSTTALSEVRNPIDQKRRVALGVYRDGYDRLVSNYLFQGAKQEVLNWLESSQGLEQIIEAYEHLEEKVRNW